VFLYKDNLIIRRLFISSMYIDTAQMFENCKSSIPAISFKWCTILINSQHFVITFLYLKTHISEAFRILFQNFLSLFKTF